jgi:FAD/FMN-containing dehydrogenase
VVGFARERALPVAAQGTGHNAAAMASLEQTVLVKTAALREVEIDAAARRARVGAGVVWAEVTGPASEHGLAPLAGSSPDVGVVGYTLGGGLSWLSRRHGLAANSVVAVEVVTADGRVVRADRDHERELFWALRGGGGSFGVVTAIEFALYPAPHVYGGALLWPWQRAAEVLDRYVERCRTAPDVISTSARVLQVPPLPDVRGGARPPVRCDRRRLPRRRPRGRRGACAAARARARDRPVRGDPGRRAEQHPHGPRAPGAGRRRRDGARRGRPP